MEGGVDYDIEHCHFFSYFFYQIFNLTLVKKYLKTAKIIDESLIFAIVLRNYSTKPSYIFQLKGTYKVRNEIETKRNQRKRNETKSTKTKRNETKSTK